MLLQSLIEILQGQSKEITCKFGAYHSKAEKKSHYMFKETCHNNDILPICTRMFHYIIDINLNFILNSISIRTYIK